MRGIKNFATIRTCLESDNVAEGLLERRTLLIEGANGHRDADHAEKPAVLIEDGGGVGEEHKLAKRGVDHCTTKARWAS